MTRLITPEVNVFINPDNVTHAFLGMASGPGPDNYILEVRFVGGGGWKSGRLTNKQAEDKLHDFQLKMRGLR